MTPSGSFATRPPVRVGTGMPKHQHIPSYTKLHQAVIPSQWNAALHGIKLLPVPQKNKEPHAPADVSRKVESYLKYIIVI